MAGVREGHVRGSKEGELPPESLKERVRWWRGGGGGPRGQLRVEVKTKKMEGNKRGTRRSGMGKGYETDFQNSSPVKRMVAK